MISDSLSLPEVAGLDELLGMVGFQPTERIGISAKVGIPEGAAEGEDHLVMIGISVGFPPQGCVGRIAFPCAEVRSLEELCPLRRSPALKKGFLTDPQP